MRVRVQLSEHEHAWREVPDAEARALVPCPKCPPGRWLKRRAEVVPGLADPLPEPEEARGGIDPRDPGVKARHLAALRWLMRQPVPPPPKAEGDGIIIAGGGKYWAMTVMSVGMCRDVSALPIQVWHGPEQPAHPDDLRDLPGITYHDAGAAPHRRLKQWEIKTIALLNCGLRRALYLDADAYPVADPAPLFGLASDHGFVYWSNLPSFGERDRWDVWDLPASWAGKLPPVQGGHFAVDLVRWRRELVLSHWMCQHGEYSYEFGNGDEGCYRAALALTGGPSRCLGAAGWLHNNFVCALDGRPVIVHRVRAKVHVERSPHLPGEARALAHLARLSSTFGSP
jgi:hypothetical protein